MIGFGQTTATDFTTNDCNGVNHNLFDSLDAGNVIVISWVMPDIASATYSAPAYNAVHSFSTSHPGRVHFYIADDYANTTCANLINFGNYFNMPNSTFFSSADISMSDYGTNGMPKVVVLGGDSHTVYYNQNDNQINFNDVQTAIANALILQTYGCTDSLASNYNPLATIDDGSCTFPSSLTIGDTYEGGIVFWLDGNGGGLIAAPSDQSTGSLWGCYGTLIAGADGTSIGTGAQNTIDIEAGCTTSGTSADICANLTLGGYSDWFLPSKDELNEMYINLHQQSLGNFSSFVHYWSSTENGNNNAWVQSFGSGINYSAYKNSPDVLRAVRAFASNNVLGCTDSTACNYDALANNDDGSCGYISGCIDSLAINFNSLATCDDGSCTYLAIGDTHQGGIIFWLDGNGGGLIAAPSDQSSGAEWGCSGTQISGADGTAIGTGNQNTIDIEAGCTTPGTAADICANLTVGGYGDWFLPSKNELNLLYMKRATVGGFGNRS